MYLNCPNVPPTWGTYMNRGGADMLVKENKCKLGGKYIFVNKVQKGI